MHTREPTFPLPGNGSATPTLSQPVAPETPRQLARSLGATLGAPPDVDTDADTDADADAGQIEYASWRAQPGLLRH